MPAGSPTDARPYTYMGRVSYQPTSVAEIMSRAPQGELEGAGQTLQQLAPGLAAAGMAKQFKPGLPAKHASGVQQLAELAAANSTPTVAFEKMWPALVDANTGQIIHGMAASGAGGHNPLYDVAKGMKGFAPQRAFVDPTTFKAYTEAMMEDILQKKYFGR